MNVRQDSRDPTVASVSNVGKREGGGGGRVEEEEEGSEVKGRGRGKEQVDCLRATD